MTVDILGLGESLELHTGDNTTFGVNDIWIKKPVDYLVCIDHKAAFTVDRLAYIESSRPRVLFSHLLEWEDHPCFELIELQNFYPGKMAYLDSSQLPKSCFSPYVAVGLAWQMFKPSKIRLFGVDLNNHKKLKKDKVRIQKHWLAMKRALEAKGCETEVSGNGYLSEV